MRSIKHLIKCISYEIHIPPSLKKMLWDRLAEPRIYELIIEELKSK